MNTGTMIDERAALDRAREAGAAFAGGGEDGTEPAGVSAGPAAATRAILDGLTVALAGASHPRRSALSDVVAPEPTGPSRLWFSGRRAPAAQAALLNGMAIHAYDFDDTHDTAIVHTMAPVLPAAIAGAESAPGAATRLVSAVAAGSELACNLALARGHYAGWHYTTLCGTLGAALAYAVAAGFDEAAQDQAVANAYVFAAGNKQAVLDSSLMKRLMPGFAAQNGVLACQATVSGLGGVAHWLTGDYGLAALFYEGDARLDQVGGGERFRVQELSYKPYPACRFTHGAIEAAQQLRLRLGDSEAAAANDVLVRYPALDRFGIVVRPYTSRGDDEMDAQFSTAYLVASTLIYGEISFASYTPERLGDARVAELARRVRVVQDLPPDTNENLGPIEVSASGLTHRIDVVLGSPDRPLSDADRRAKFATCRARQSTGPNDLRAGQLWDALVQAVDSAARERSAANLLELLGRAA